MTIFIRICIVILWGDFSGRIFFFNGILLLEISKKGKMTLPDESRDLIGKSQEIWN